MRRRVAWLLGGLLGLGGSVCLAGQELRFTSPPGQPDLVSVQVTGLPTQALERLAAANLSRDEWTAILPVIALVTGEAEEGPAASELPPLLGTWIATQEGLEFRPRFPPAPGMTLRARFDGAAFDRAVESAMEGVSPGRAATTPSFEASKHLPVVDREPSTEVLAVYPSAEVLPSNLLRFYVHFSAPMSARRVLPHVRLVDVASGVAIPDAFVFVEGGLWDPERTRLTLLVHPGRVKRGVGPHVALGPVLEEGGRYRLEIDREARDGTGLPLRAALAHEFRAGPADQRSPDPAEWSLITPTASGEPLVVDLAEAADHALLERVLEVTDAAGQTIAGRSEAAVGERRWTFQPAAPWRPGTYRLVIAPDLEDPSGNRVGRRFEEPLEGGNREREVVLEFEVR